MCMIDYAESNEFYSSKIVTARKHHKCGECWRAIEPGERYHKTTGKTDGSIWTEKHCSHCQRAADLLMEHCHGFLHGGMQEDLQDHVDPALPWAMKAARCVVGMRRGWKRFRGDGLMTI